MSQKPFYLLLALFSLILGTAAFNYSLHKYKGVKAEDPEQSIQQILPSATSGGISFQQDISYGDDPKQKLDLCTPANTSGKLPAVMLIHGGGGDKSSMRADCKALAANGVIAIANNYREEPSPSYQNIIGDNMTAYNWLVNQKNVDKYKIGAMGTSMGGYIAGLLGVNNTTVVPLCVVNNFGPTDFTDPNLFRTKTQMNLLHKFFGVNYGENPQLYQTASPINHLKQSSSPNWLFTRSRNDRIIPKSQMERMVTKLDSLSIRQESFEYWGFGFGHANYMLPGTAKEVFNKRINFLLNCLQN